MSAKGVGKTLCAKFKQLAYNTQLFANDTKLESGSHPKYSLAEVRSHCDACSCWIVLSDMVYDVTDFLAVHPGGEEILLEHAGSDATVAFESKGHSTLARGLLEQYCVGELEEKDKRFKT